MLKEYFQIQLGPRVQLAMPLENTSEAMTEVRRNICAIPGVPPHLPGVVNQRGRLLWVLDLAALLGVETPRGSGGSAEKLTLLALSRDRQANNLDTAELPQVGCLVTELKGVINLDPRQLKPLPSQLSKQVRPYLHGIVPVGDSLVAILDIAAVFRTLRANSFSRRLSVNP